MDRKSTGQRSKKRLNSSSPAESHPRPAQRPGPSTVTERATYKQTIRRQEMDAASAGKAPSCPWPWRQLRPHHNNHPFIATLQELTSPDPSLFPTNSIESFNHLLPDPFATIPVSVFSSVFIPYPLRRGSRTRLWGSHSAFITVFRAARNVCIASLL